MYHKHRKRDVAVKRVGLSRGVKRSGNATGGEDGGGRGRRRYEGGRGRGFQAWWISRAPLRRGVVMVDCVAALHGMELRTFYPSLRRGCYLINILDSKTIHRSLHMPTQTKLNKRRMMMETIK